MKSWYVCFQAESFSRRARVTESDFGIHRPRKVLVVDFFASFFFGGVRGVMINGSELLEVLKRCFL